MGWQVMSKKENVYKNEIKCVIKNRGINQVLKKKLNKNSNKNL